MKDWFSRCVLACRNPSLVGKSCSELELKMHSEVIPGRNWVIAKNRFLNYSLECFFFITGVSENDFKYLKKNIF